MNAEDQAEIELLIGGSRTYGDHVYLRAILRLLYEQRPVMPAPALVLKPAPQAEQQPKPKPKRKRSPRKPKGA